MEGVGPVIKPFFVDIDIYRCRVIFCIGTTARQNFKAYCRLGKRLGSKKWKAHLPETKQVLCGSDLSRVGGRCYAMGTNYLIWLDADPGSRALLAGMLAHEALHTAIEILVDRGHVWNPGRDSDEPLTYLVEYLVTKATEKMQDV